MRVTTSRYETNFWSTQVNNVRLAEPIRRPVRWRAGFSKSRGLSARVSFFPLPPLSFFVLVPFLARPKQKIPFLCLSLLRNQTETLATQAIIILSLCNLFNVCKYLFFCTDINISKRILMLKADVSMSSWHHSQGKTLIFACLCFKKSFLIKFFVLYPKMLILEPKQSNTNEAGETMFWGARAVFDLSDSNFGDKWYR